MIELERQGDFDAALFDVFRWPEKKSLGRQLADDVLLVDEPCHDSASRELLMRRYLTREERADYEALTPRAQRDWLVGRVAVKEVVVFPHLILPLLALQRVAGSAPAVVLNALLWGVVHSLVEPLWGLVVWWPFLILSIALLAWRERGLLAAVAIVTAIHTLQNAVAAALALIVA